MKKKAVKDYITDALFELLKTKPLNEITATEVISKAGVCRSSYYRNYYLLEDIIRQYAARIFQRMTLEHTVEQSDPISHMTYIYECYLQERERLTVLDKQGLLYLLEDSLYNHCMEQIISLGKCHSRYQVDFFAGAATYLIRAWIHNGFSESPLEMAQITYEYIKWDDLRG